MVGNLTPDEAIETLRRSHIPTVVTEGADDYEVYRRLEASLDDLGVSFFPVGGRNTVLEIFERRKEIGRNDIVFVVDRDMYVYAGIPNEYNHRKIIFTDGYSIENDLARDYDWESLLGAPERPAYVNDLKCIVEWFSFCMAEKQNGRHPEISVHPNRFLRNGGSFCNVYATQIGYNGPVEPHFSRLMTDYKRLLRGKTLLALLVRHLSRSGRRVRFNGPQLMEIAANQNGPFFKSIAAEVEKQIYAIRAK